jgi:RNA polymerase sigma-70 factor (ECF subfamily)
MSSYAEPSPTAIGLRALLAAVTSYRTAARAGESRPTARASRTTGPVEPAAPGTEAAPASDRRSVNGASRRPGALSEEGSAGPATAAVTTGSPSAGGPDGLEPGLGPGGLGDGLGPGGLGDGGLGPGGLGDGGTGDGGTGDGGSASGGEVWTLVRAAQGGDPEAFGQIYDRYVDLVFRYAYHRLGDRALAEDLTSETFVRALRRLASLTYQGRDVGAWLVTITRNLILDHLKSSRHRMEVVTDDLRQADRATDGPENTVLDRLTSAALLRCVRQLGAEQQECVVLRFLHGLSVAETAAIMGKNEGAIKALQHRAIRRLATLLPEDPR